MEFLPKETETPEDTYDYPPEFYATTFSPETNKLREYIKPEKKERKNRNQWSLSAIEEVFRLTGGVPRMAAWAEQNYGQFMKMISRTVPAAMAQVQINTKGPVQIISPIGPSALDAEYEDITPEQKAVNE